MVSGIKSKIILRKKLIASPSIKKFLKRKIRSDGDKSTDFHNKKVPKVGPNYTSFAVILIDFGPTAN